MSEPLPFFRYHRDPVATGAVEPNPLACACCGDACEFHGDAPEEEMRRLDQDGLVRLSEASMFDVENLRGMIETYVSGCSLAFYKFVCRHCARVHYNADCD